MKDKAQDKESQMYRNTGVGAALHASACLKNHGYRLTIISRRNTIASMITGFHDEATEQIWLGRFAKKLPNQIQTVARRKLRMLNNARIMEDLRVPPANRLEKLSGNRDGQWSIRINDQLRVCFVWDGANASRVEICDYH